MVSRNSVPADTTGPGRGQGPLHAFFKELGDSYAVVNDHERATECYWRAAGLEPDDPGPHLGLAALALGAGRLDDARQAYEMAISKDSQSSEAWGGLAMTHQHAGKYDQAQEAYLKCLELDPDNLVALLGLFQTSCHMGSFARIITCLEVYLAGHPNDTSVLLCLATLYGRDGMLEQARVCLDRLLSLEPHKHEAREMLDRLRQVMAGENP